MKKLICSALVPVFMFALCACSNNTPETEAQEEEQEVTESLASEETGASEESVSYGGVEFETEDLDGNAVDAQTLFASSEITMLNFWGTYCGPCINEMPDLEALNQELQDTGVTIVGVVVDVSLQDDSYLGAAEDIIAQTGVTYKNLMIWDSAPMDFDLQFVPTTVFIDSEGNMVGEPVIGSRGADEYMEIIRDILSSME
jgi:thiol-disulfide isomerase/thioredoxin